MGKANYKGNYNKQDNRGEKPKTEAERIAEKGEGFLKKIAPALDLVNADTQTIKDGVSEIDTMMKLNWNMTTHQVRNIFDLINGIDIEVEEFVKNLNMLRPKLAYIGARQTNVDGKIVVYVLDKLIIHITNETDAKTIKNKMKGLRYVMESIVAYQKYYSKN